MDRRSFLTAFLGVGGAALIAVAPAQALPPMPSLEPAPFDLEAAIAASDDLEGAKIEKAYWVYRRRRVYRPRYYRRRYYYYRPRRCFYTRRYGYIVRRCY